jgi:hypothetical protein
VTPPGDVACSSMARHRASSWCVERWFFLPLSVAHEAA